MAIINGTSGNDSLVGTASADTISGLAGNDTINAGAGNDVIIGGAGTDIMTGGTGNDRFVFAAFNDIANDTIKDFAGSDVIDLSQIDTDPNTPGDQGFGVNNSSFPDSSGTISFHQLPFSNTWDVHVTIGNTLHHILLEGAVNTTLNPLSSHFIL